MFKRLADCDDNYAPAFVLDLLPASLNNLLEALEHGQFVGVVIALELFGQRHEHRVLPRAVLPAFITTGASSATPTTSACLFTAALGLFHRTLAGVEAIGGFTVFCGRLVGCLLLMIIKVTDDILRRHVFGAQSTPLLQNTSRVDILHRKGLLHLFPSYWHIFSHGRI